ncbi:unnamed protein product [Polarella glacialis]|uniref:Uncharacterized protein n=1 Tax=Polarella glacialis TaxID=89957 RepID=A0A813DMD6_POLGL|nr:unnamed protein product [Polarella glacialis]CAE8614729.1 unnamed protein product [Polarella glacialis]CAE8622870.1 unnamed protein product [Polarella glacialis]CAE8659953.1 unnamed protein product [Polarella glacialis]
MPSPHPLYEPDVPKDHCRVRCCNEEGQEWPGQKVTFQYAHSTLNEKGVVKRKPVFSHYRDHTYSLLEPIFRDLGGGSDYERLSDRSQKLLCEMLDRCDLEAVNYHECEAYVDGLLDLCSEITRECTGMSFAEWGLVGEARQELGKAWMHFVRLIWMRDIEWENLIRYISDPNAEWSVSAEYFLVDPTKTLRHAVSQKLMVPLQVWAFLLKACYAASHARQGQGRSYI